MRIRGYTIMCLAMPLHALALFQAAHAQGANDGALRLKDRCLEPAVLDAEESSEASRLESGVHFLESGKQILKLDSGLVVSVPTSPGGGVASSTAVEVEAGVWVEPEIRDAIDQLRAIDTKSVLKSLPGDKGLMGFRAITSERPIEFLEVPLNASFGSALVQTVVTDLRFDRLLKDMGDLDETASADLLRPYLERAIDLQTMRFDSLLAAARREAIGQPAVEGGAELGERMDRVMRVLFQSQDLKSAPNVDFAYSTLLLLAATLRAAPLHDVVLGAATEAVSQRDALYKLSQNAFVVTQLAARSLYHRQALAAALVGTSKRADELAKGTIAAGALPLEGETLPFDAYNTYEIGLAKARSGTGKHFVAYGCVSDTTFDAVLKAAQIARK